jgi:hypothetical protein
MATITAAVLPFIYTEAEAVPVNNVLNITAGIIQHTKEVQDEVRIKVTVGTFQFSVGAVPTVNSASYTVNEEVTLKISKSWPLYFKGTALNDAFKIAY